MNTLIEKQSCDTEKRKTINCSRDVFDIMYPIFSQKEHEEVWLICLNRAGKIINKTMIHKGGRHQSVADPVIILKKAILSAASSIILCHNHPSGCINPSKEDDAMTEKIFKIGKLLDLSLHDHIIVGDKTYYSYADEIKICTY